MENNDIIKIARAKAEKWLDKAYDEKTRAEAKRMLENTDTTELVESYYNDLEFGTGGLRGSRISHLRCHFSYESLPLNHRNIAFFPPCI